MLSQIRKIAILVNMCIDRVRQIILINLSIQIIELPEMVEADKLIILILIKLRMP